MITLQYACTHIYIVQLNEWGYYAALKGLIEEMYEQNNYAKVNIVVHSKGAPVSLYFLTSSNIVTQEWKDTYINAYITLAGAWSGANNDLEALISGPPDLAHLLYPVTRSKLRSDYRTWPGPFWQLPRASVWNNTVLVYTPKKNYTTNDYQQLFEDAKYPQGYAQFSARTVEWSAPNVSTYCFYGLGFQTPEAFVYRRDEFPDSPPASTLQCDGDKVVTQPSAEVCLQWANSGYPFKSSVFDATHFGILNNKTVLETIGSITGAPENPNMSFQYQDEL